MNVQIFFWKAFIFSLTKNNALSKLRQKEVSEMKGKHRQVKEEKWFTWKDFLWLVGMMAIVFLSFKFLFTPVEVRGESMDPTLASGERLFGLKVGDVRRFDIVALHAPDVADKDYIKRVIGLPGEQLAYKNDTLYINGKKMSEPYLDKYKAKLESGQKLTEDFSYQVPNGQYFVMGDNRQISKDSRYFKAVDEDEIIANTKFVYWPLNKIGGLK